MTSVSTTNPDCVLRDKLKNVKMALKTWSKEKYRGLDAEIETARKEAVLWEKEAESRTLVDYELAMWQKARADWIEKDGIKAKMLKQKARIQWYEEGDENSKYFHAEVRKRYRKNGFRGLMVDGMWCENPATIKQTVYEYFKGVYAESGTDQPKFISNRFKRLSEGEANLLEAEFEEKEVWEAVKACGSSKTAGLTVLTSRLPIGNNMGRIENWKIMVDTFKSKLADWKAKMISFGRRLTLVKSVLGSLSLYFFSLFRAPVSVLHSLESVWRGGLNIGSLKAMNCALLSKWWWRFRVENEALWVKVIKSVYGAGGGLLEENISFRGNSVWGNIMKVGRDLGKIGINLAST
nr:hypothetical protein [Tanacetum cinerariifolium]